MIIKVAIADDHPMVVSGLQYTLGSCEGIEIMGTFGNGTELINGLREISPDILLLDIQMPDMTGNDLARIISDRYPRIGIIAVTSMNTSFHINDMLSHGCMGYVLKSAGLPVLLQAIKQVYAGRQFIDESLRQVLATKKSHKLPALTRREKEVLQLIIDSHSNQEIADKLFLNLRTIETHRYNLMQKMGVKNVVDLVKSAMESGLIHS